MGESSTESWAAWSGDPARLDRALFELGLARSRSHAAELIARGRVRHGAHPAVKAGERVNQGAVLAVAAGEHYVSRAAHKLIAGLDAFGVDAAGALVLDLGASTGGFTQVLLERGAREVIALDVGHAQLAHELRTDPRVRVVEGCNARELDAANLAAASGTDETPSLVVGDLSFISLALVLPAIARATPEAVLVLLIKPQFEVGRLGVRDGLVADTELAVASVLRVIESARAAGFSCAGLEASPITGEHGNRELLAHFIPEHSISGHSASEYSAQALGRSMGDPPEWEQRVRELLGGEA